MGACWLIHCEAQSSLDSSSGLFADWTGCWKKAEKVRRLQGRLVLTACRYLCSWCGTVMVVAL